MTTEQEPGEKRDGRPERRRHSRFPLGLPVRVCLAGRAAPVTMELLDVSAGGGRFRAPPGGVTVDQRAAFGFVVPDLSRCLAKGRVLRIDPTAGHFVLSFDDANDGFRRFLRLLTRVWSDDVM
jgi:hypothetical protein